MSKGIRQLLRESFSLDDLDREPRVLAIGDENADPILDALSSDTTREIFTELRDEPAPPADLSEQLDLSLQNVHYHLRKLEEASLVEEVDTWYSDKGVEMSVYAQADSPLIISSATGEKHSRLRSIAKRIFGVLGVLGVLGLVLQQAYQTWAPSPPRGSVIPPESSEPIVSVPPIGVTFFVGGVTAMFLIGVWIYAERLPR